MTPDSYLNIQIVRARARENRRRPSIYSIKLWGCVGGLFLCTGKLSGSSSSSACSTSHFSPSGDHLTELAFRDITLRMEAYRACSTSHSPNGSLQSLLYKSLSEWKLTELALRVTLRQKHNAIAALRIINVPNGQDPYHLAPVFLSSGEPIQSSLSEILVSEWKLTELALRVTLRQ